VYRDAGGTAWAAAAPAFEDAELWVPRSSSMLGYRNRLAQLLGTLSELEGRPPAQILFEITHALQDIQRVRSEPLSESGTIELGEGTGALAGIHKWVLSAATATATGNNTAILPSRRPVTVDSFMAQVKLATPEPGSFVWKIAVPLVSIDGTQPLPFADAERRPELASFNRQVTRALYDATAAVLSACRKVREGASVLDSFQAAVPEGVSANLCEGLAETSSGGRAPFEIGFSWATNYPAPPRTETLRFAGNDIEVVETAATELRRVAREPDVQLGGYIVRLKRESEQRAGEVTIAGTVVGDADEKFGHFWFELTDDDYLAAVESHRTHRMVTIRGDIVRRGNRRWLELAHEFQVLDDSEA